MALLAALLDPTDRPSALTTPEGAWSRHELLAWAAAVATDLAGQPIVAVHAVPGAPTVVAITAALLAGVPIVPVPPDAGHLERAYLLRDSGAALLLSDDPAAAGDSNLPVVPITRPTRSTTIPAEPHPSRPALVLYTSGTTGAPKGVVLSRAAITADLDALAEAWQWTADDTLVHGLPLYHVHGLVLGVLGPLRLGAKLAHTGRPTPQAYAASPGTMYFGVPTVWSRIAARPAEARRLAAARLLVSGSAPLPAPVFADLLALTGQAPVERYGMTETLITISARADGERRPGQVGLPLAGIATRLVDESGSPVPADGTTIGHLQVRGPTLFDGYLGAAGGDGASPSIAGHGRTAAAGDKVARSAAGGDVVAACPAAGDVVAASAAGGDAAGDDRPGGAAGGAGGPFAGTAVGARVVPAGLVAGWYRTGDVATVGPDGWHRIVGRASVDLIKTGGYRVGAGEVEDVLLLHPAVREVAVVGLPDPDLGERITAFVVGDSVRPAELIAFVAERLAAHKRPRAVHLLAELPRNSMGKVQKNRLRG